MLLICCARSTSLGVRHLSLTECSGGPQLSPSLVSHSTYQVMPARQQHELSEFISLRVKVRYRRPLQQHNALCAPNGPFRLFEFALFEVKPHSQSSHKKKTTAREQSAVIHKKVAPEGIVNKVKTIISLTA
eukprot:Blabericola_migrator_1__1008@NODE_1254_length_4974_cov_113_661300_g647_i1_p7_GENE_NODE_1254_length_4974_cov_113_661300_g647_i1NODE_1254_length_4974_cov_113_661300_g647_i1_p7_ORF_typecomplete_len131_score17_04_NODE_1254_length_4974_cov_113_661300_g647_i121882580